MKMTTRRIVDAYRASQELSDMVLPFKVARTVARLRKRLGEEYSTVLEMEKTMVDSCHGREEANGYRFPTEEEAKAYYAAHRKMLEQEDDINLPVVDLSAYASQLRITPGAIEALEGLVIFEKEDEA